MTSYEKQMQWKQATSAKSKKDKEERVAGESNSFTPVMYTHSVHDRHNSESKPPRSSKDSERRETVGKEAPPRQSKHQRPENDMYSPVRGTASVNSHQNSDAGHSGYGNAYLEQANQRMDDHHHAQRAHSTEAEDPDNRDEDRSQDSHRPLRTSSRSNSNQQYAGGDSVGRSSRQHDSSSSRRRSQGSSSGKNHHSSSRRDGASSTQPHRNSRERDQSPTSSLDGSSQEEDEDEADEPIIELLERERKQWREEREKLIQCIHLQQLELSQRSVAAHERAADIAKEFARAIECFEERLVSVEGTVQKEIMSIKSIAESLLHAANQNQNQGPVAFSGLSITNPANPRN